MNASRSVVLLDSPKLPDGGLETIISVGEASCAFRNEQNPHLVPTNAGTWLAEHKTGIAHAAMIAGIVVISLPVLLRLVPAIVIGLLDTVGFTVYGIAMSSSFFCTAAPQHC